MRSFTLKQRKSIALNIRNAMEKSFPGKGSGKRLAAELGVAPSAVSQWATGKKVPSLSSLYAMSRLFGIPLHRLCDLPAGKGKDTAFEIMCLIAAGKNGKGKRVNPGPADAGEREAVRLICRELRRIIGGAPNSE